ncbi:universal stress protein [Flavobacterium sp. K5-23]|uniref:universal stress protein n=1 Tax=Flavobacterium sp. K5-23 TaxID=2746225 RepID=UPI00200C67AC|nr:universal stress protein [Flavobacterium sp. K5-23]UQD55317.1 universal stress protein [Flavobacterium sp. K5-23]
MEKILVTTDFSANSKAAMRFAIQLASQKEYELTFFHSYSVSNLSSMSDAEFTAYEKKEAEKIQKKLNQFVEKVYIGIGVDSKSNKCVIKSAVLTDSNIREYAVKNKFSFICISTRGSGKMKKIFGSNTSNLIRHSAVPVISIPYNYRRSEVTNILYASDFFNFDFEFNKVMEFATPLMVGVDILHFKPHKAVVPNLQNITDNINKYPEFAVKLHIGTLNMVESLQSNIQSVIKRLKPSMLIMFTQQNRSFLDKIFVGSKSVNYSFYAKVPLLVFKKINDK